MLENLGSVVLEQGRTKKSKTKSSHLWLINFWQSYQGDNLMGLKKYLQWMVLRQEDRHIQKIIIKLNIEKLIGWKFYM